jgi:hypothetical protein
LKLPKPIYFSIDIQGEFIYRVKERKRRCLRKDPGGEIEVPPENSPMFWAIEKPERQFFQGSNPSSKRRQPNGSSEMPATQPPFFAVTLKGAPMGFMGNPNSIPFYACPPGINDSPMNYAGGR